MFNLSTAVGFFGIHYTDNLNHWMGWNIRVDYSKSLENNKKFVFDHFNVFDYYSSTYFSSRVDNLILDFDFESLKLSKLVNERSNNVLSRNMRFKEVMRLILDSKKIYDIVILSRFDLKFFHNITDLNINLDKVNVVCKNKCGDIHDLADDNFYIIPYSIFKHFYDKIDSIEIERSSHEYNRYVDMHYMQEKAMYSHEYTTFTVNRLPII